MRQVVFASLVLALAGGRAAAQPEAEPIRAEPAVADAVASGKAVVAEAERLAEAGKYELALAKFLDAARAYPSATHDCAVAFSYFKIGSLSRARLHLDLAGRRGDVVPRWCDKTVRRDLERELARRGFAALELVVTPEDAVIAVGDVRVLGAWSVWLPAGDVAVHVEREGYLSDDRTVALAASGARAEVALTVRPPDEPAVDPARDPASDSVVEPAAPPDDLDARPPPEVPAPLRPRPTLGWVALAGGVVGLGAGAYFHARALSTKDEANGVFEDDPRFDDLAADFRRQRLFAVAGYAVGGIALGVGAYLLLRDRDREREPSAAPSAAIGVVVDHGGAIVTVGWERW